MTPSSLRLKVAKLDSRVYIHVQPKMLEAFTAILVPEQYCYTSNVVSKRFNDMVTGSALMKPTIIDRNVRWLTRLVNKLCC